MQILIKLLALIAVFVAIDFAVLNGRYSTRVWQEAHQHGQTVSAEFTRLLNKVKF